MTVRQQGTLVVDIADLDRGPGNQLEVGLRAPAPADLGIDVLHVPEGEEIRFALRLESVMEGVLATGVAQTRLAGECIRCLEDIDRDVRVRFTELYLYPENLSGEGDSDDDEVFAVVGDTIDLEQPLRDALVLDLPFQPVCRDDCPGLPAGSEDMLIEEPASEDDEPVDSRWAALAGLADRLPEGGGAGADGQNAAD